MSELCAVCKGSGALLTASPLLLWNCLYCDGSGVRVQFGPARLTHKSMWGGGPAMIQEIFECIVCLRRFPNAKALAEHRCGECDVGGALKNGKHQGVA